jgi:alginate O-acetyltransferase complex protein AlgI
MNVGTPGAQQGLFLDSWHFFAFVAFAVLVIAMTRGKNLRAWVLLPLNLYFLAFFTGSFWSAIVLAVLVCMAYAVAQLRLRYPAQLPIWCFVAFICFLWAFLFLVKDPNFFAPYNPFFHAPVAIIGISYLTFRAIHYVVDIEVIEDRRFLPFLNYMVFFATLIAGPIERYDRYAADQDQAQPVDAAVAIGALHRIANGFIKKFVLADNLAALGIFQNSGYDDLAIPLLWLAVLIQLFIIYLDFSGYSDIVIAIARLMGFRIMENFDRPFAAGSIQEFWNRWHISLTSFVRDYVFTPIAREILFRTSRNWHFTGFAVAYFISMLVIALWHGTTSGFLLFGVVQGAALVGVQLWRRRVGESTQNGRSSKALYSACIYVFMTTTVTLWYFGPVSTLQILKRMIGF